MKGFTDSNTAEFVSAVLVSQYYMIYKNARESELFGDEGTKSISLATALSKIWLSDSKKGDSHPHKNQIEVALGCKVSESNLYGCCAINSLLSSVITCCENCEHVIELKEDKAVDCVIRKFQCLLR